MDLCLAACQDFDARSDSAAVTARAFETQCDPMIPVATFISVKTRSIVHIDDENVDVAIIIEVAESGASRRLRRQQVAAKIARHLFELPAAGVAIEFFSLRIMLAGIKGVH